MENSTKRKIYQAVSFYSKALHPRFTDSLSAKV